MIMVLNIRQKQIGLGLLVQKRGVLFKIANRSFVALKKNDSKKTKTEINQQQPISVFSFIFKSGTHKLITETS